MKFPATTAFGSSGFGAGEDAGLDGPSYFDVLYLDDDMLVIRQNEPGGIFISVRESERMQ